MLTANKYRIKPNKEQASLIDKTIGCSRLIYNLLLDYNLNQYKITKKSIFPEVTHFKNQEDFDFLFEVDSLALANAKINVQNAFKNFFRSLKGKRKGKKSGFPKFKSKKHCKLSYSTNNQNGSIRIEKINNKMYIKIPKLGFIELVYHREVEGEIKSATITKIGNGKYEISILNNIEKTNNKNKKHDLNNLNVVGIDMSFHDVAVLSTGEKANHPRYYRKSEVKLGQLQRKMHKKQKRSNNRNKSRENLKRKSLHVSNQRKDFLHKLSKQIIDEFDVIVLEDINMQNMSRQLRFGKSVGDMGFGMFREFLIYKAKLYDKHVYKVDRFFPSSQLCSGCGFKNKEVKNMAIREWVCPKCGEIHDRDVNAAKNLKQEFEERLKQLLEEEKYNTVGTTGIYACGDETPTLSAMIEQVLSLKQEAPAFMQG